MTASCFDISGRVALVTGGRRGLGAAMSAGLAAAGARLAVASASAECDELRRRVEAVGGEVAYFQANLADSAQRAGLVDKVAGANRKISSVRCCSWPATLAATSMAMCWSSTAAGWADNPAKRS